MTAAVVSVVSAVSPAAVVSMVSVSSAAVSVSAGWVSAASSEAVVSAVIFTGVWLSPLPETSVHPTIRAASAQKAVQAASIFFCMKFELLSCRDGFPLGQPI